MLDLYGWIWCAQARVFFAALLWWQEVWQARELVLGISVNKAALPSPSSSSVLARWHGAGQWLLCASVVLLRWKTTGEFAVVARFNKRCFCFFFIWISSALLLLWACRGGLDKDLLRSVMCSCGGGRDTAHLWSSSSVALVWLPTQDAGGQQLQTRGRRCIFQRSNTSVAQVWPPNLMAERRLSWMRSHPLFNLHEWRPFKGAMLADPFFHIPSGPVLGEVEDGRQRLQFDDDDGAGLDSFSFPLSRVCVVKRKDFVAISCSSRSPSVSCNHTCHIKCTD